MKKYLWSQIAFAALLLGLITQCQTTHSAGGEPRTYANGEPFDKLSDYGLFQGRLADLAPNNRVLPYDLNSPLFTDYAHKFRTVWLPNGKQVAYNDSASLDFPVGTIISKTFYYPNDFRDEKKGRRILETRLLVRDPDGWSALPYIWNAEQTDAFLEVAPSPINVSWIHSDGKEMKINYAIPNVNQCKGCHANKNVLGPIGPKARNLNRDYVFADGKMNQLDKWTKEGILTGYAGNAPRLAKWDDPNSGSLEDRARSWLEINCAHCHNPNGAGGTSGLDLTASVKDPTAIGICKTPVAAGRGSGGHAYDIAPGKPDESILVYRMETNDPGQMMPELGRTIVHKEGVALVREWIASMKPEPCK